MCMMRNQHGSRCSRVALLACVATAYAWQPRLRQMHHHTTLHAKRAKKSTARPRGPRRRQEKPKIKQRRKGRATDITPAAVVANGVPIPEDHRFEQFFYDAPTSSKMMRLVRRFEKPLLVCVPSIAAKLDANGEDYLLLDRDARFSTSEALRALRPALARKAFPMISTRCSSTHPSRT